MIRIRVLALAAILAASSSALADDRTDATGHFQAGVALVDRGNDRAALVEFEQAYKLVADWQYLFNIGVLQRKLFRYGEAIRTFERYLSEGGANVPAERRIKVEKELGELRSLVGDLAITVEGPPARVEIDDLYVGDSPLAPQVVAVGPHRIRATRDGSEPAEQEVRIVKGERVDVTLIPKQRPTTAQVTIKTRPVTARLRIDDTINARSPWTGELRPGGHRVIAEAAGYRTSSDEITVDAGQARGFTLELVALPERRSLVRRKAFWIALGVVVIAGTVAGIAYATRPEGYDVSIHYPTR